MLAEFFVAGHAAYDAGSRALMLQRDLVENVREQQDARRHSHLDVSDRHPTFAHPGIRQIPRIVARHGEAAAAVEAKIAMRSPDDMDGDEITQWKTMRTMSTVRTTQWAKTKSTATDAEARGTSS